MARLERLLAGSRAGRLGVSAAVLALLAGCGESGGGTGGSGTGAAGGGGAPVEGCVDIRADQRVLDEPDKWRTSAFEARQPFWVDERGVHYAWVASSSTNPQEPSYLVVTSFDRETGAVTENRFYDAFPPEVGANALGITDAAGSADGAFAAAISYADASAPWGLREPVALGHLDQPGVTVWQPPWTAPEAWTFDVGWDGEAFAVHGWSQTGPEVRLVRLAPDGTVLTPDAVVGAIGSAEMESSAFLTDADSGKSWMLNGFLSGAWLSGHERDGTPFAGTEADGGVTLPFYGNSGVALAAARERALIGGSGPTATWLQALVGAELDGEAVVLLHDESFLGWRVALAADSAGWWMGLLEADTGIHSYRLGSGGEVLSKSPLVTYTSCSESCFGDILSVFLFSTARYQDELWFGFVDRTDWFTISEDHPARHEPFRILKVKDGCIYLTEFELNNPPT